jgi:hypothetical protein
MRHPSLVVLAISAVLAACASQSPDAPTASPTGVSPDSLAASAGSTPALDVLRQGGSYMFSLDESAPSATFRQQCAQESGGDSAKAEACYAHVREVGSHEGIRFSVDAGKRIVMTSFGLEDGKEAVYLEGPMSLAADGDHAVVGNFAAVPHGLQMQGKTGGPDKPVRIELPDDKTMVMIDDVKGRLVFHRAGR